MTDYWQHLGAVLVAPFAQTDSMPSILLVAAWFALLRYFRYSGYGIALLSLAGTSLHEAAHFCVGFVLQAKPVSVNLFPKREGNGWTLGSVGFTGLNIFNSAFVAFAPLLLLGLSWCVFTWWLLPAFGAGQYLSWAIAGYVCACAMFSSIPSMQDIRIGALSTLMYGAIGYGIWHVTR
jgi:hypothetical protein